MIVSLTIKLLGPVSFADVLRLASEEELVQALDSPAPAANILAMTVLHKAAAHPDHAAALSAMPALFAAFVRRWLAARAVEVGQKGGRVLGDLLDVDCSLPPPPPPQPSPSPPPPPPAPPAAASQTAPSARPDAADPARRAGLVLRKTPGHGRLWRLLFGDRHTYALLLDLCAGRHPDTAGDAYQLSLAQGRLLRILPRLAALDFGAVSRSQITAPTPVHLTNGERDGDDDGDGSGDAGSSGPPAPPQPPRPGEGLLQFAALRMVQKSDRLMHLNLVDFFEALVSLTRVTMQQQQQREGEAAAMVETLRAVVGEAVAGDAVLREALLTLPDRTVEEEAEDLRRWLGELLPGGEEVRLAIR